MATIPSVFTALALWAATPSHALDVCRKATTDTNAFDDASQVIIPLLGSDTIVVDEEGGTLSIRVSRGGLHDVMMRQGWPMTFALENGAKITFFASRNVEPTGTAWASQYGAGVFTSWNLEAMITAEAAHAIAQSPPVALRYSVGDEERTVAYGQAGQGRLAMAFACAAHKLDDMPSAPSEAPTPGD